MKAKKNANKTNSRGILPKNTVPNFNKPIGFDGKPLFDPDDNLYGSPFNDVVSGVHREILAAKTNEDEADRDEYDETGT